MPQIKDVGSLDTALTGTELVAFQEAAGGASSTKRTTTQAIVDLLNTAALSNDDPLVASGLGAPGSAIDASRSDHVHPTEFTDLAALMAPQGAVAQTYDRRQMVAGAQALNGSGFLYMVAIPIEKYTTVTTINLHVATAAVSPTNQWAGLFDSGPVALRLTADHTTQAYAQYAVMSLDLTTPYVTGAVDALYYVGLNIVASTMPTFYGYAIYAHQNDITPKLIGNGATGLTAPPSLPYDVSGTKATWTATGNYVYVWLT